MDAEKKLHLIGMTGGHENGQRKMTPRKVSHDSGTLKPLQDLGTGRLCWIVEGSGTYQFHIRRCFYTQRELPIVKTEYKINNFLLKWPMWIVFSMGRGPRSRWALQGRSKRKLRVKYPMTPMEWRSWGDRSVILFQIDKVPSNPTISYQRETGESGRDSIEKVLA